MRSGPTTRAVVAVLLFIQLTGCSFVFQRRRSATVDPPLVDTVIMLGVGAATAWAWSHECQPGEKPFFPDGPCKAETLRGPLLGVGLLYLASASFGWNIWRTRTRPPPVPGPP